MAVTLRELRKWIASCDLCDDSAIYIDDEGLVLCADDPGGTHVQYLEVGGVPEGDEDS